MAIYTLIMFELLDHPKSVKKLFLFFFIIYLMLNLPDCSNYLRLTREITNTRFMDDN